MTTMQVVLDIELESEESNAYTVLDGIALALQQRIRDQGLCSNDNVVTNIMITSEDACLSYDVERDTIATV